MGLIISLIVGGLAGWLASLVMGNDARQGIVGNVIVGIVGSFIGNLLYSLLFRGTLSFGSAISGFNLGSILLSTLGAIVLLAIMKAFNRQV